MDNMSGSPEISLRLWRVEDRLGTIGEMQGQLRDIDRRLTRVEDRMASAPPAQAPAPTPAQASGPASWLTPAALKEVTMIAAILLIAGSMIATRDPRGILKLIGDAVVALAGKG